MTVRFRKEDALSVANSRARHRKIKARRRSKNIIACSACMSQRLSNWGLSGKVTSEEKAEENSLAVTLDFRSGIIHSNLTFGTNVVSITQLKGNSRLSGQEVIVPGGTHSAAQTGEQGRDMGVVCEQVGVAVARALFGIRVDDHDGDFA